MLQQDKMRNKSVDKYVQEEDSVLPALSSTPSDDDASDSDFEPNSKSAKHLPWDCSTDSSSTGSNRSSSGYVFVFI